MMRFFSTRALLAAIALTQPLSVGCVAILGDQEADATFPVKAHADGTWSAWNEISVDTGGQSVDSAILLAVTLDTLEPAGTPDMSYLTSLIGEGVAGDDRQLFCTADEFPVGEQAVVADVVYHENIIPFFQGSDTIRVEWHGTVNPRMAFPPDGYRVRVRFKIEPE